MKKLLIVGVLLQFTTSICAQENNLYNQVGLDYVKSVQIIVEDFNNGKIKDLTKETIDEYSQKIPSKIQMDIETAGYVISSVKTKGHDLVKKINESNLTLLSKKFLIEIAEAMYKLSREEAMELLTVKVGEIETSDIPKAEKELILSFIAIGYQSYLNPSLFRENHCIFTDQYGQQHEGTGACILAGAGLGYLGGNAICGTLCGVGGAIIGGVVGAIVGGVS